MARGRSFIGVLLVLPIACFVLLWVILSGAIDAIHSYFRSAD